MVLEPEIQEARLSRLCLEYNLKSVCGHLFHKYIGGNNENRCSAQEA